MCLTNVQARLGHADVLTMQLCTLFAEQSIKPPISTALLQATLTLTALQFIISRASGLDLNVEREVMRRLAGTIIGAGPYIATNVPERLEWALHVIERT